MNLLQLKYFHKVVECKSLTKAAKELIISTPSLCSTIKRLELDLGCKLFNKVGRTIQPNENGLILFQHANNILTSLQAIESAFCTSSAKQQLALNIGLSSPTLWVDVVNKFLTLNPHVTINCEIIDKETLSSPTLHSNYDFIFAATSDFLHPDWEFLPLITNDPPMLIVYEEHPMATLNEVKLRDIKSEPFIALKHGTLARDYFDMLFAKAQISPNIVISCDYMLRSPLIRSHYGIGLTTLLGSKTEILTNLKCVKIIDPPIKRTQAIFRYKNRIISTIASKFQAFVVKYFKNI